MATLYFLNCFLSKMALIFLSASARSFSSLAMRAIIASRFPPSLSFGAFASHLLPFSLHFHSFNLERREVGDESFLNRVDLFFKQLDSFHYFKHGIFDGLVESLSGCFGLFRRHGFLLGEGDWHESKTSNREKGDGFGAW